ncbi:hypothetical protein ASO20_01435 [Mycoplasma sp. (ex Biomphalaria glabrata)]|uniref:glutamate--tRNA ligase n=1 Tax=Mycoplasma sp. (ex Biomphalaria glabrata) TaxID=1749074 RepID=UPI00073ACDE5|nr:glutamate--tRNA ligase [Mycoplasma sp. (ex Biomphalaria glabrata)]ALV23313.1 hypothetical protein ASO20_01435 [Mycoplasma sp. (ex Biomphalaria glabrata)]
MKKIRVRYAPSPTGQLHIGGARSALINYLFAKHYDGDFLIRIEDTDVKRNVATGIDSQLDNLEWLGIIADESIRTKNQSHGPYIQSERFDLYLKYAEELIEQGHAYYCFCTEEELDKKREIAEKKGIFSFRYDKACLKLSTEEIKERKKIGIKPTIRLNIQKDLEFVWNDVVRGRISINSNDIDDYVIIKSNGIPTYNFAVVIDDHLMEITHVFRGEEHIANTPKQLAIYQIKKWQPPIFGHLTLITNSEGKKLSKRDESLMQFIEQYKNSGYLPSAIFNFLALLGWSPEHTQEIMTSTRIINEFNEKRLSKSPSKFDVQKLNWINTEYIKKMSDAEYVTESLKYLPDIELTPTIALLYKREISCFNDLKKLTEWIYKDEKNIVDKNKILNLLNDVNPKWNEIKDYLENNLSKMDWNEINISSLIKECSTNLDLKGKPLFMSVRLLLTNREHGPELAKTIFVLGKERVVNNLKGLSNVN